LLTEVVFKNLIDMGSFSPRDYTTQGSQPLPKDLFNYTSYKPKKIDGWYDRFFKFNADLKTMNGDVYQILRYSKHPIKLSKPNLLRSLIIS
jgi:hypothetical protein